MVIFLLLSNNDKMGRGLLQDAESSSLTASSPPFPFWILWQTYLDTTFCMFPLGPDVKSNEHTSIGRFNNS